MDFMEPQNVPSQVNEENQLEKRTLFKRVPSMTGLSLINPWHAVRSLLNPDIPQGLQSPKQNSGPELSKGKLLPLGPMIKREAITHPKYYWYNKRGDIMRYGKRST